MGRGGNIGVCPTCGRTDHIMQSQGVCERCWRPYAGHAGEKTEYARENQNNAADHK